MFNFYNDQFQGKILVKFVNDFFSEFRVLFESRLYHFALSISILVKSPRVDYWRIIYNLVNNHIFTRKLTYQRFSGAGNVLSGRWKELPGGQRLKTVSKGDAGIWGVDYDGKAYQYDWDSRSKP